MCDNGYGLVKIRYFDEPVAGPTHIIKYTYIQSLLFLTSVTAGDESKSSGRSPSLIRKSNKHHILVRSHHGQQRKFRRFCRSPNVFSNRHIHAYSSPFLSQYFGVCRQHFGHRSFFLRTPVLEQAQTTLSSIWQLPIYFPP